MPHWIVVTVLVVANLTVIPVVITAAIHELRAPIG